LVPDPEVRRRAGSASRYRRPPRLAAVVPLALLVASGAVAQQVADTAFTPPIPDPAYPAGTGPVVLIDEAHHNFHTAVGRFRPFARLLERDGYVVRRGRSPFTRALLDSVAILVVANALGDTGPWVLPTRPAFSDAEVTAVRGWVEDGGGALLLIADHMPFPGAAEALGRAFGVEFLDGFAFEASGPGTGIVTHTRADGALPSHPIADGRTAAERVDSVRVFTGQAFRLPGVGQPLLRLVTPMVVLLPDTAWRFNPNTPRVPGDGLLQGVALARGRGRVVVFGEAAMFTAQLAGANRSPMGMNHPAAPQNAQYALNALHWLSGLLEPR
jgi:hypothetical protein